ncbi:hypothetical protein BH09CHL1_BH09CHL1_01860 [soil metagenome]
MLVGYVSDERYVAIADVAVEIDRDGETIAVTRSTARGKILVDIEPGTYRVTLVKSGFGSKSSTVEIGSEPHQFRLLSDCLLGYVWPKWVQSGERSEFRVHAVEPYRLSLWRYGREKEFVKLLGWFDEHGPRAVMQITPDGDYTQTGIEWNKRGYASAHHTQFVTGPEKSGLYYLEAETESESEFFSFPWIVAPETPSAEIAVIAATNDWNAYNNFGGRSNYVNATGLPSEPAVNARQDLIRYADSTFGEWKARDEEYKPLSFDRPELGNNIPKGTEVTDPIRGRTTCGQAPAEWRLLGWLEQEGYGYDLFAEHQLHSGVLDLDQYKVLIISVHPEYWSREMYVKVKTWVHERGGRFMYLGGNGLNCEIEFLDDATMWVKSFLPSEGGSLGFVDPETGEMKESRFHRSVESEGNLTGLVTTDAGIMTSAPFKVIDSDHWVYAGTDLKPGDLFGIESLHERVHGGASGHETDKISAFAPKGTVHLAKGINIEEGGADMIVYELENGGKVFSVGSITWVASLFPDPHVPAITKNVIDRFLQD